MFLLDRNCADPQSASVHPVLIHYRDVHYGERSLPCVTSGRLFSLRM